jgi:sigma-B regulation protein RsbU (phosphoserine phosphatase)
VSTALALPDADQLRGLSAFHGDSTAAWRLYSELLHRLYGQLSCALVLRPAVGAPRLVALSHQDGSVRIEAVDPYDEASAALALVDRSTHALLQSQQAQRMDLATDANDSLLWQLLALPCAIGLPLYARGAADLLVVFACEPNHPLASADLALLGVLANCLGAYLGGAIDRQELAEQTRLARVQIRDLADVQRLLLPDNPDIRGLAYAIHYQPSAAAGGDYYDLMRLSHRIADYPAHMPDAFGLMLADVSGHGAGAAMEAVQFDAILRTYKGGEGEGPAGALTYANRHFFSRKSRGHFMTALGFLHLPHQGQARLCNAGHLPPLRRRSGRIERLSEGRDIPIGILREHRFDNHVFDAEGGDILVFYTDGITEARNSAGHEFGVEGLEAILQRSSLRTPEALLSAMLAELYAHQGDDTGRDDQTLVVLRLAGAPATPR